MDLGTKYKTAGAVYRKSLDAPGRQLDLEAVWREKGAEVDLIAIYKHDTQKKASVKYVDLSMWCTLPAHCPACGPKCSSCQDASWPIQHRLKNTALSAAVDTTLQRSRANPCQTQAELSTSNANKCLCHHACPQAGARHWCKLAMTCEVIDA